VISGEKGLTSYWLGRRPYAPIHELMRHLFEARKSGAIEDTLLVLEHEPVITMGRGAKAKNLLSSKEQLTALGVHLEETHRGGDVTLHAPGQLVAYPIVDLAPDRCDVRKYVQGLTRVMAGLVAPVELDPGTLTGKVGLWVDLESPGKWPGEESAKVPAKLGAVGVSISRWVTQHGFALNLTTDLSLFSLIVPCGIEEFGVASVESVTGRRLDTAETAKLVGPLLARELGRLYRGHEDLSAATSSELLRRWHELDA
jgi:lipoyl(octanoyl) transferase